VWLYATELLQHQRRLKNAVGGDAKQQPWESLNKLEPLIIILGGY